MVNNPSERLDSIFSALSDSTRRAILERLSRGEANVTELALPFEMSLPAISKHLRILEQAGLIIREREGRIHHIRLSAAGMQDAALWLEHYRHFWDDQFDNLAAYLDLPVEDNPDGIASESP